MGLPLTTEAPRRRRAWLLALAASVLTLLLVVFLYSRSAREERSQFVKSAQAELERLRVPWEGRRATVSIDGDEVTVVFPPPRDVIGGRFIVKMERDTKKILDVKIWR